MDKKSNVPRPAPPPEPGLLAYYLPALRRGSDTADTWVSDFRRRFRKVGKPAARRGWSLSKSAGAWLRLCLGCAVLAALAGLACVARLSETAAQIDTLPV